MGMNIHTVHVQQQHETTSTTDILMLKGHPTRSSQTQQQLLLWRKEPNNLPDWMKEYMDWHHDVVTNKKLLTNETKHEYNFLILRCLRYDERCGGVSDRLKPIPLFLLAASKSKRLFFIYWDRPCPLERFLVPPNGGSGGGDRNGDGSDGGVGFQWSMPSFLVDDFNQVLRRPLTRASKLISGCQDDGWIKSAHLHDATGGAPQYDEVCGKDAFLNVYHDMFRSMFVPSPQLQSVLDQVRFTTGTGTGAFDGSSSDQIPNAYIRPLLRPGTYSVAHYRAEYGKEVDRHPMLTSPEFIQKVAINSLRCAIQLQPNDPIYFASDNMMALQFVRQYASEIRYPIYTFDRQETIVLRLDEYNSTIHSDVTDPSGYYSTFIDLYLAGNGRCVTFGRGGFGRYANLLSTNSSCAVSHVRNFYPVGCVGHGPLHKDKNVLRLEGFKNP